MSLEPKIVITPDTPGLTDVPGLRVGAAAADVRGKQNRDRLDLALVVSERPCTVAGVFTIHDLPAAPVRHSRELLAGSGPFFGFVANSGNANACTGGQGRADNAALAARAEAATGAPAGSFFVASTGRIGRHLPMDRMLPAIDAAAAALGTTDAHGTAAAGAILTSDTRPKTVTVRFDWQGTTVTLAGIAKGAGMIQPQMGTMLAFVATDAAVPTARLQAALLSAVRTSFNAITVDGDRSTNDTVLVFAHGGSGVTVDDTAPAALQTTFEAALRAACEVLAEKIVGDGERITKVVEIRIDGARSDADAEKAARALGNSLLVKSSWYGHDPNWGRLADALGYAGIGVQEETLELEYDDTPVLRAGESLDEYLPRWREIVRRDRFSIRIRLGLGSGTFRLLASDLTEGYVDYNKSE